MIEVIQSVEFREWLRGLRDRSARVKIGIRLERLANGNPGDVKPVGKGVSELRIDFGPGYRVYFIRQGLSMVFLLAGGDKSSQERDILRALELADEFRKVER